VKTILRFIVVALVANATWHVGSALTSYYKFKDSVYAAAMERGRGENDLREKIVELASTYDMPVTGDMVRIRSEEHHTIVEASFTQPISVLPGYQYPWPFSMTVDAFLITPVRLNDLVKPPE
jgi:hypothetical protein